jgi:hypothetical protein
LREVKQRVASGSIERTIAATVAREVDDSIDEADVARLLQVSVVEVGQRRIAGELWGFENEGTARYPCWQFDNGHTIPGLREIVHAIAPTRHPFTVNGIMRSPQRDLIVDGVAITPRDWLLAGRSVAPVLVLLDPDSKD